MNTGILSHEIIDRKDLTIAAKMISAVLLGQAVWDKSPIVRVVPKKIAEECSINRATVERSVRLLAKVGVIERHGAPRSQLWKILNERMYRSARRFIKRNGWAYD